MEIHENPWNPCFLPALVSNIRCGPVGAEHNRHDMTDGIYEKVGSDTRDRPQSTTKAVRPQKSPATAGFRTFAGAAPTHLDELPSSKQGVFLVGRCLADQRLPGGGGGGGPRAAPGVPRSPPRRTPGAARGPARDFFLKNTTNEKRVSPPLNKRFVGDLVSE